MTSATDPAAAPWTALSDFLLRSRDRTGGGPPAISLFSGAGLSDIGYELAGFEFLVHAELEPDRAELCATNFPHSTCVVGDLCESWENLVREYRKQSETRPALLVVTPPCQGLSSSNPGRGKVADPSTSDERNLLMLASVPVIQELQPRIVVVENVPQVLTRVVDVEESEEPRRLVDVFEARLGTKFRLYSSLVQMADYGVPQDRRRAILVAVHADEPWLSWLEGNGRAPFPRPTHAETPDDGSLPWVTLEQWFSQMKYPSLDAGSLDSARCESDPLHSVPRYQGDRYLMVADIPARSGRNAYENSICHECGREDVPEGDVECPDCGALMRNRPYVQRKDGTWRLVKGFRSSYRRMHDDRPAPTVTTASSHLGSDYKIHPWENRVLSIRECADLQTVPRFYDWEWAIKTRHTYLARQVIGEALPPLFTYLHGQVLGALLNGQANPDLLAQDRQTPD